MKKQLTKEENIVGKPKTVYSELKLSEQLSSQLQELKNRFDDLMEELESASYERDYCKKQLNELLFKYNQVTILIDLCTGREAGN